MNFPVLLQADFSFACHLVALSARAAAMKAKTDQSSKAELTAADCTRLLPKMKMIGAITRMGAKRGASFTSDHRTRAVETRSSRLRASKNASEQITTFTTKMARQ